MNYEIRKVANGYLVIPERLNRMGDPNRIEDGKMYVFNRYSDMVDKLQQLLEQPETRHGN